MHIMFYNIIKEKERIIVHNSYCQMNICNLFKILKKNFLEGKIH